jgi:hypothetical protein
MHPVNHMSQFAEEQTPHAGWFAGLLMVCVVFANVSSSRNLVLCQNSVLLTVRLAKVAPCNSCISAEIHE